MGYEVYPLYKNNMIKTYIISSVLVQAGKRCVGFCSSFYVIRLSVLMIKSAAKAEILSSVGCMGYVFHYLFALCWTHDYH